MDLSTTSATVRAPLTRRLLLAFPALLFAACAGAPPRPAGPVELVVLHVNDMHGQVHPRRATWVDRNNPPLAGGLPRVAAYVKRVREEEQRAGRDVLVLDGGDWHQGTPEGLLDQGREFVRALAAVGFDAMALGNHEFDHGVDSMRALLADVRPPVVCANLRERASGERVAWVEPWRIVEVSGLRVALVGFVTPETPSITHPDARTFDFTDPAQELTQVKRELGSRVDWILPLGHIGVDEALALARAHPELPLIVTGHSHTFLREGRREGGTLIVQAGAKASVVGRVELTLDGPSAKVTNSKAQLVELLETPSEADKNARVETLCAQLAARAESAMGEVVGELSAPLTTWGKPYSTSAGSWICDLMRARTGVDVAFHNRGGVRAEIDAGPVTRREVFEMSPFDNNIALLELTGAELEQIVRAATEGTAHSGLDYSGCVVRVRESREHSAVQLNFVSLEIGGKPLEREKRYRVATNSYLAAGGDGFDLLARSTPRSEDPILIRDLTELEFKRAAPIAPPTDARIVAQESAP
jgi:2',3'-cyclic-nucleotide 2'-phosphodiesterase (5'-nucleotidase family)